MPCYSDHDEDIRTKGSCDYCADTEPDRPDSGHKRHLCAEDACEVYRHTHLLSGWWTEVKTPTGWKTVAGPFPGFVEAWEALR